MIGFDFIMNFLFGFTETVSVQTVDDTDFWKGLEEIFSSDKSPLEEKKNLRLRITNSEGEVIVNCKLAKQKSEVVVIPETPAELEDAVLLTKHIHNVLEYKNNFEVAQKQQIENLDDHITKCEVLTKYTKEYSSQYRKNTFGKMVITQYQKCQSSNHYSIVEAMKAPEAYVEKNQEMIKSRIGSVIYNNEIMIRTFRNGAYYEDILDMMVRSTAFPHITGGLMKALNTDNKMYVVDHELSKMEADHPDKVFIKEQARNAKATVTNYVNILGVKSQELNIYLSKNAPVPNWNYQTMELCKLVQNMERINEIGNVLSQNEILVKESFQPFMTEGLPYFDAVFGGSLNFEVFEQIRHRGLFEKFLFK